MALDPGELRAYQMLGIQPVAAADIQATVAALVFHAGTNLPDDALRALRFGLEMETSQRGRAIYRQLLENAAGASAAGRPSCQDTGQAVVFADLGQDVHVLGGSLEDAVNSGVAEGYASFRKSIVRDALFDRSNTRDNTPAIVHLRQVPGRTLTLALAEKGYGSENKSHMVMHPVPNAGIEALVEVVREQISRAGGGGGGGRPRGGGGGGGWRWWWWCGCRSRGPGRAGARPASSRWRWGATSRPRR